MPSFTVELQGVCVASCIVEADNEEEASKLAYDFFQYGADEGLVSLLEESYDWNVEYSCVQMD